MILLLVVGFLSPRHVDAQERFRLEDGGWRREAAPDPRTPEGQLQLIRRTLAEGHAERAKDDAARWIKRHRDSALLPDAYLLHGDARVAAGNEYKALYDYERIVRDYPGSEQFHLALEREFHVAQLYAGGLKRKFIGLRILGAGDEAEELMIRTQERAPGSDLGEQASMALGDLYFRRGEMASAAEAYALYLENYPRSERRERAMLRVIQADLASFKGPNFDATGLVEAGQRLRQFKREFPASAERIGADGLLSRIDESLAAKTYGHGGWYERRALALSAATTYRQVIHDQPQTSAARAAVDRLNELGAPVAAPGPRRSSTAASSPAPPAELAPPSDRDERGREGSRAPAPSSPLRPEGGVRPIAPSPDDDRGVPGRVPGLGEEDVP